MPLLAPVTRITFFPMLSLIQCVLLPETPVGLQQRSPLSTGSPSTHTLPFKGSATPGVQLETAKLLQAYVIRNCPFSKTLFAFSLINGTSHNLEQASREFSGIGGRSRTPVPGIIYLSCATAKTVFVFRICHENQAQFTCGAGSECSRCQRTIRSAKRVSQSSGTPGSGRPWENN